MVVLVVVVVVVVVVVNWFSVLELVVWGSGSILHLGSALSRVGRETDVVTGVYSPREGRRVVDS